jgi:phosphopantetheinyl transferase
MPIAASLGPPTVAYTVAIATRASLAALTRGERQEYDRLPHDERRRDWLAGRLAAKRAVAEHCRLPFDRVRLESRTGAAPSCMVADDLDRWSMLPVMISIGHCDGVGIAAAADRGSLIGVDVERAGDIGPAEYRYFLAPGELAFARRVGATLLWVLKEAVWKALGLALSTSFASVTLDFEADDLRSVSVGSKRRSARARVVSVPERSELVAAAVEIDPEDA